MLDYSGVAPMSLHYNIQRQTLHRLITDIRDQNDRPTDDQWQVKTRQSSAEDKTEKIVLRRRSAK